MKVTDNQLCRINQIRATRIVSDDDIKRLRALADAGDDARFAAEFSRLEANPENPNPPDALDANEGNPYLPRYMRATGVTAANVREHGPRGALDGGNRVLPNLRELWENTESRGDRPGTGK